MKQKFSKSWLKSKQPRKQRKYMHNAPLHLKRKMMASPLSKEMKRRYGVNAIEIRKDDEVKVMRGKFKKKQGKVLAVNMKKMKIAIEGIQKTKIDGTKVNVWIHPSKVQIVKLYEEDRKRLKNIKKPEKEIVKEKNKTKPAVKVKEKSKNKEKKNAQKKK